MVLIRRRTNVGAALSRSLHGRVFGQLLRRCVRAMGGDDRVYICILLCTWWMDDVKVRTLDDAIVIVV